MLEFQGGCISSACLAPLMDEVTGIKLSALLKQKPESPFKEHYEVHPQAHVILNISYAVSVKSQDKKNKGRPNWKRRLARLVARSRAHARR